MTKLALSLALILAATVSARAEEAPAAVSTINGQLVKVGDHHDYLYPFKPWNVSTNPLGLIYGSYGVSLSYGVGPNLALRGDLNVYKPVGTDTTGWEIGVGLPLYLRRTYSGFFVEPGLIVRSIVYGSGDPTTTFGPQVLLGWHWTWDSGFNVAVAAGIGRNWSARDSSTDDVQAPELFPNGYLRVGYSW